ncbi:AraC family transcriptional regulator [Bailinhaonella thermotolerans]|uniref:AraC family transcriptional regulator n=1 Tax=Bailinhaonella thermotolerans TaxID=1070861 RepID=A0A3A4BVS0_9ACTN|nr:AraC family transcriptional regulator [Bailinhaonella thermotolerans]
MRRRRSTWNSAGSAGRRRSRPSIRSRPGAWCRSSTGCGAPWRESPRGADAVLAAVLHELILTGRDGGPRHPLLARLEKDACSRTPLTEQARRLGVSLPALRAIVRGATGVSPQDYILGVRPSRAKDLLAETDLTVAAVARGVGYEDAAYFSRLFTRRTGVSPRAFRQREQRIAVDLDGVAPGEGPGTG